MKYIPTEASTTAIYLPNGTYIAHLNDTPLLDGGENTLLSASQDNYSGISVHEVAKHNSDRKYISYKY